MNGSAIEIVGEIPNEWLRVNEIPDGFIEIGKIPNEVVFVPWFSLLFRMNRNDFWAGW